MTVYDSGVFTLSFDPTTGEAITRYAGGRWSGCAPVPDDAFHAERLGITRSEHRLEHELAHHLFGYAKGFVGSPIIWRDAHGVAQKQPDSDLEEWMVTALQYLSHGHQANGLGRHTGLEQVHEPALACPALALADAGPGLFRWLNLDPGAAMKRLRVTASALNLRAAPQPDAKILAKLPKGTEVDAVAPADPWRLVQTARGEMGWVHGGYLAEVDNNATAKPGGWRLAKSLVTLRDQVNRLAPQRSRTHDGTIGDQAHAARKSDHNPNADGVVTAIDITDDPAHGCDCERIVTAIVKSQDPRLKYAIWRGRIVSSKQQPWKWRPYTGANKHDKHLHISVDPTPVLYDDARSWKLS